jgi:enoyl-[acyl-carrier protein] reductase II
MKAYVPVRLLKNKFYSEIKKIEESYIGVELKEKLIEHLGKYRARNGMLLGDIDNGELEIGQCVSLIKNIPSVEEVMQELISDYQKTLTRLPTHL